MFPAVNLTSSISSCGVVTLNSDWSLSLLGRTCLCINFIGQVAPYTSLFCTGTKKTRLSEEILRIFDAH